jgi:(2Fe-2S) ferredoxin
MKFERVIFVCTNERPADHPRGSCAGRGSNEVLDQLRSVLKEKGLNTQIRPLKCGCLDICEIGPNVYVTPDNVWYMGVKSSDVPEIVEEHLVNNRVVTRLVSDFSRWNKE